MSAWSPIAPSAGSKTPVRYGTTGLQGTCVPPRRMRRDGAPASTSGKSNASKSKVTEPALGVVAATSISYSPARIIRGTNCSSVEPSSAPFTVAPEMAARARTTVKCCGCRPGFGRHTLTRVSVSGRLSVTARASAVRSICPPPSP